MPPKGVPIATVIRKLEASYDPPKSFLHWDTPFHLLIATILSAQCTDARVNIVTQKLFQKYKTPTAFVHTPIPEIEADIRPCGHYHNKAKFLRETSRLILENFGGDVPETMEELITLPGVGRKTAACVLYAAFNKREGIPVDTHVLRLSLRLGLTHATSQEKIELDLMRQVPKPEWGRINPLLISHGRAVCTARNRQCDICMFRNECPSSLTRGLTDLAK